jgi:energy-coupling factor transporter ATP-binding protein EcfA2
MITAQALSKRYGDKVAVDNIAFTVRPGVVTGFPGPNGAGKSTTMRLILGLDAPTWGEVTVNGKRCAEHRAPLREVGALLEARAVRTGRIADLTVDPGSRLVANQPEHKPPGDPGAFPTRRTGGSMPGHQRSGGVKFYWMTATGGSLRTYLAKASLTEL